MKKTITPADVAREAAGLGVDQAALQAVLDVETPGGGFFADGQVAILFERHYFSRLTGGKYDRSHPDISGPQGGYGTYAAQHPKLQRAVALNRDAALQSASWGKPQIMGENWRLAGATSLQDFVNKMSAGEPEQLSLMANYLRNEPRRADPKTLVVGKTGVTMLEALRTRNWRAFARLYNGPGFAKNAYPEKLDAAFRRHGGK